MDFSVCDNWDDFAELKVPGLTWDRVQNSSGAYIFSTVVGQKTWSIRLNDFPDEPMYTLVIDGFDVIHFNDWPTEWIRSKQ